MDETGMDRVRQQGNRDGADPGAREREQLGWLREFLRQFELAWQLLWDARVPFSTKLVPLLTAFYFLSPIDIVPDAFLGLGQVDDLVVILIGLRMFISLCPPEIVSQYRKFGPADEHRDRQAEEEMPEIIEVETRIPGDPWQSATLHPNESNDHRIEKSGNKDL